MNVPIISSNCKNGPQEILQFGKNGLLFDSNNRESLFQAFLKFENMPKQEINKLKYNAKLKSKEFSVFNHFKKINYLLEMYQHAE